MAGIKATVVMVLIFFTGFVIAPFALQYVTPVAWISLFLTAAILLYVFRADLPDAETKFVALICAVGYFVGMYVGGEIIFIGLVLLGIFLVALFLIGDGVLTGVFTYRDLCKWVKEERDRDRKLAVGEHILANPDHGDRSV